MEATLQKIKENKLVAILRDVEPVKILRTCKALHDGGIECIEVTFNQLSENGILETVNAIKQICENTNICVGAGTVMTVEQVVLAVKAGAKYIISPNFDEDVVKKTVELGAVSIPGVLTPSEIVSSYKIGASFVKLFPGGLLGPQYIKAVRAPISHIPIMVVGGVGLENIREFLHCGVAGFGIGSSLVNKKLIIDNRFDELKKLAEQFINAIK